jgi:hypothetical protein
MTVSWAMVPILFASGVFAGFVNTVAGGGSFFSFPLLILLGVPAHVANGTIRVTVVMQNLVAVPTYARGGYFRPKQVALLAGVTIPFAILGSLVAVRMDPEPFRKVCAVLLIIVVGTLFLSPRSWTRAVALERIRWPGAVLGTAAVGLYGGFFQLGAGIPFLAVAVLIGGWDLVTANSLKVGVILLYTIVAVGIFASYGQIDWMAGVSLGLGNMLGAWLGARLAVRSGTGWIRWVMVAMGLLAVWKLLRPGA